MPRTDGGEHGRRYPSRFTAVDVKVLPPENTNELRDDPYWIEDTVASISANADTFEHLLRYGPDAYPDGLRRFGKRWRRSMAEDLPRLERMGREGELARMDRAANARLDPSIAGRREPLPERYEGLKRKLAGLLPIMRKHGFAEPTVPLEDRGSTDG